MAPFLSLPFPFSFRRESAQGNICLLHSSFATASAFDTAQGSHSVQLGVLGHSAISYSYFAIYYKIYNRLSSTTARNNNTARWPESRQVSALPDLRSYPQGPMLSALGFRSDETAAKCSSCFAASLSRLLTLLARLLPSAPRLPHPNPFGLRHVARHSPGGLRSSAVGFSCSPYGHARASARALPCGAFRGRSVWVASFNRCQRFVAGAGGDTPRSPMQLTMLILSGRSTVARVPN